ncbi:MAG TPA: trehalose-6-phosphate synthase [Bryobacteraceae bacterium]|nr:trehalose-6-phosphate synthase [Bryobacteraceae bacterium]
MKIWTKESLHQLVGERLSEFKFIAVSNREPYIHRYRGSQIECIQPASGLATAIDPIMRASGGTWVAHGSGVADRAVVDRFDRVQVPPQAPGYTLRRVWLPETIERGYYYGLANEGLWPLCHIAFQRPRFHQANWDCYRKANEIFAAAVLEEAGSGPAFVFIQDYHLALLPRMLKQQNPNLVVAQFWHIPWPNRETFRAFPWKQELIDGMLGNDVLGFHLSYHCSNFLDTVDRNIEALVDTERSRVTRGGHETSVRAFPISIDFDRHSQEAATLADSEVAAWSQLVPRSAEILGIGIDRIDYTKGILERLDAVDKLLQQHSEYRDRFVFLQVGVPSRSAIADYQHLDAQVLSRVEAINARWKSPDWQPIVFVHRHIDQLALMALHRMADFCVVSSLHDGMNLVAKEFVASRTDEDGVLILSRFTGAARELTDALLVNPFAPDEIASAMLEAIRMPDGERRRRMQRMRSAVASHNIYRWAGKIVTALDGVLAARHEYPVVEDGQPIAHAGAA